MRRVCITLVGLMCLALLGVRAPDAANGASKVGSLDPTFGIGGVTTTDFAGNVDVVRGLALQPDGGLVVGGITTKVVSGITNQNFGLARYRPDGSLDPTFGV